MDHVVWIVIGVTGLLVPALLISSAALDLKHFVPRKLMSLLLWPFCVSVIAYYFGFAMPSPETGNETPSMVSGLLLPVAAAFLCSSAATWLFAYKRNQTPHR